MTGIWAMGTMKVCLGSNVRQKMAVAKMYGFGDGDAPVASVAGAAVGTQDARVSRKGIRAYQESRAKGVDVGSVAESERD